MFIEVTAEDETEVEYYEVIVLDLSDEVDLVASDVEDAIEWTLDGTTLTVEFEATVADLMEALDLVADFQEADVYENNMDAKLSGELNNYNYLVIIAQDGETEETYLIMIADEPAAAAAVPSDSTDISSYTFLAEDDEADLLADLEDAFEDMTFEVFTSEGLVKDVDEVFEYDLVVVTAEDGTTTETVTVLFD